MEIITLASNKWFSKVKSETGAIGEILESILTETQFQASHGEGWILMDGRNITGSKLHQLTSMTAVPDGRAMFLRGKNNGRSDGFINSDGELGLGDFSVDKFQGHQHSHTDDVASGGSGTGSMVSGSTAVVESWPGYFGGSNFSITSFGGMGVVRPSSETRPKNITVNFFIKIN